MTYTCCDYANRLLLSQLATLCTYKIQNLAYKITIPKLFIFPTRCTCSCIALAIFIRHDFFESFTLLSRGHPYTSTGIITMRNRYKRNSSMWYTSMRYTYMLYTSTKFHRSINHKNCTFPLYFNGSIPVLLPR